ncbi:MAG: VCBS repeat-containing protein, partial [Pseudomonadota bacterium]
MAKQRANVSTLMKTIALGTSLALVASCGGGGSSSPAQSTSTTTAVTPAPSPSPSPTATTVETSFTDATAMSGLRLSSDPMGLFTNQEIPRIFPHGVAAGDYDNDGDVDLFIAKADGSANHLYRNEGDLVFADVAVDAGVAFTRSANESFRHGSPAFVDLNSDGLLDLFIPGLEGDPTMIFVANGDGTFSDATVGSGLDQMAALYSHSPAFGDYDRDGDLDLFLGHWGSPRDYDNVGDTENLWRNDSDASGIKFTSVSVEAGIAPSILTIDDPLISQKVFDHIFTPTFSDVDGDGWPDLLVVGDFNFSQVFINQQDGTFSNETDFDVIIDGNGMGSAVGDFDNDGDLDWFVSSILARESDDVTRDIPDTLSQIGNRLYRNNSGVFEDVTDEMGVADGGWGWGSCFIDFENDGDLDIYQTNGWPQPDFGGFDDDTTRAFVAGSDGKFIDLAGDLGLADTEQGRGVVCDDFDNDGDVDVLLLHLGSTNAVSLWRNDYQGSNSFLKIILRTSGGNRQSIGARISVRVDGVTRVRAVALGSNFASHN